MTVSTGALPVVVGVGSSGAGRLAVQWAADEAALRHAPLRLVHALEWPPGADPHPKVDHPERTWSAHYRATGQWLLNSARETVSERHPGLAVESLLADGPRSAVLYGQSEGAGLVVVGARRPMVVEEVWSAGGLGVALASHAHCPVVVVRPPEHAPQEPPLVVVGVDGSRNCRDAVAVAFEEAALRGARLLAVEARPQVGRPLSASRNRELEMRALTDLAEATAGWRGMYPDVEARHEVIIGSPAHVLLRAAAQARCLVVGSRGLGGFRGLLLGSVSHVLMHRTPCPVIVVPHRVVGRP